MGNQNFADNGSNDIDQGVAFYQQGNYAMAFQSFMYAAIKGNPIGMNNVAVLFMNGQGTAKDECAAFEWTKRAADIGYEPSYYTLAVKYFYAVGVEKNLDLAYLWAGKTMNSSVDYKTRANASSLITMIEQERTSKPEERYINEGFEYYKVQRYDMAMKSFLMAAELGNPVAMNNVSILYFNGHGVPVNLKEAFVWMKKAAECGYAPSFYPMATKYFFGKGTEKDLEQAEYWVRKTLADPACEQEKPDAAKMLDQIIQQKNSVKKQNTTSSSNGNAVFSPAEIQMYEDACTLYNNNQHSAALPKLEALGKKGHPAALRIIGHAYLNGLGVPKSVTHAYDFFKAAALRGDERAVMFICKYLINRDEFSAWKAYGQNRGCNGCENTLDDIIVHERNRKDTYVFSNDAREAMMSAAECWRNAEKNYKQITTGIGNGSYAAFCYFQKAGCFGNLDALCGKALYMSKNGDAKYKSAIIEAYKVAGYCGHSYAMYRVGQYYDGINKDVANKCYIQSAKWGYQPAKLVCDQRGLNYNNGYSHLEVE